MNFIKKLPSSNGFSRSVDKSIIHQVLNTSVESTDNAETPEVLNITIAIKDFRYSSLDCAKFDLIASKLVPLDSRLNKMLTKFSFIAKPKKK